MDSAVDEQGNLRKNQLVALAAAALALVVSGLGFLALAGWIAGVSVLASFGEGKIPMAPSTALFFILAGGMVLVLARPVPPSWYHRFFLPLAVLLTLVSLVMLTLATRGIHFRLEYLGLDIVGVLNGIPLGHVSPLTAFGFVLAGMVLVLLLLDGGRPRSGDGRERLRRRRFGLRAALGAAAILGLLAFTQLLAYLLGVPILQGSGLVPPALPTSLAFLLLAFSLQTLTAARLWPVGHWPNLEEARSFYALIMIFVALIGGIAAAGFVSFRQHEQEHRAATVRQLTAVVDLKTERIVAWLREFQRNSEELADNHGFAVRVEQWLRYDSAADREIVQRRLRDQQTGYNFCGITLLDGQGRSVYALGESPAAGVDLAGLVELAAAGRQVVRSDLYRHPAGGTHLAWVVPIFFDSPPEGVGMPVEDGPGPGDGFSGEGFAPRDGMEPMAFVVRYLNAADFLLPFLATWPGASRSAETLLVRRQGDEVLLLSDLKIGPGSAFNLRLPLARQEVPAVQAVLGREGVVEGRDYRGVPVLAALKAVPETSWFLVARLDMAEMYGPLRERLWIIVLALLLLVLGAGGGVGLLWRRQRQLQNFTMLKQIAARDRHAKIELERRVAQRTAQLVELNRELETFSYSVSHDLKAPLRGIEGYSKLLEQDYLDRLDEDGRLFIRYIRQGVAEMEQLIAGVLAYSRMERRPLRQQEVNLATLVETVLAGFSDELAAAGTELQVRVPAATVRVDPEGLSMVLRNLVDNAIKFSRAARPPRLKIDAEVTDGRIGLTVQDNGIGFDQKFAERIFEIFARLTKADDFPGTGIGLAMVRKAVQRMGGGIGVESAPGRGTTFLLDIPVDISDDRVTEEEKK